MKNIHVLPTDKPSRLFEIIQFNLSFDKTNYFSEEYKKLHKYKNKHIYITNDEEIKEGDLVFDIFKNACPVIRQLKTEEEVLGVQKTELKIILTTDQDLIKNGVQAIDDEFLEWFVKNPSCENIEVKKEYITPLGDIVETCYDNERLKYKIIIPKEEPKQENCCTPVGQIKRYLNCVGCDRKPKQETLEHTSKFIAFTLQDSESWIQHSIPLDSFEKADNFCQQFRDRKMSYLICKTLKQGYNGK